MTAEINFVKGIGLGIQYEDELIDETGTPVFVIIIELLFIRILIFTGGGDV